MSRVDVWMPFPDGEGPDNWPKRYVSEADYEALRARVAELEADAARWAFYREHRASLVPNSRTRLDEWLISESLRAGGVDACIDEMMRLSGNKTAASNEVPK